jgi:hypothetical protein
MSEATEIAERIASALPDLKRGTLRMFGDWFGRPWDNLHTIVAAEAEENCLILHFDEGETLRVWEPGGDEADASLFRIWRASRVLWQWYAYGRPHLPQHRYFIEYVREDSAISVASDVNWYTPRFEPTLTAPAVEIC